MSVSDMDSCASPMITRNQGRWMSSRTACEAPFGHVETAEEDNLDFSFSGAAAEANDLPSPSLEDKIKVLKQSIVDIGIQRGRNGGIIDENDDAYFE